MEEKRTITELSAELLAEMGRLKYSKSTVQHTKLDFKRLSDYIQTETGQDYFTEDIGARYLDDKFGYPSVARRDLPLEARNAIRCVRRIGEFQLNGAISRAWSSPKDWSWYLDDKKIIAEFIDGAQTADNTEGTKANRRRHLKLFYEFLACRKENGIWGLSGQLISDFAVSLQGYSQTTCQQVLATLRNYLRFLFRNGYSQRDWSFCVPKVHNPQNQTIPTLWEEDEIKRMLNSIDRSSPVGKRDYAIVLLALQLGLRSSDVAGLHLESLKWGRKEIELVQQKTSTRLVQPLLNDVGWAIIDYIRFGRPNIDASFVFFTAQAPYVQIGAQTVSATIKRYMNQCGIKKPTGTTRGLHSLRHAFARRLLEQGTPLPEVADIMGHTSCSSTIPYLRVDIDRLRGCALSLAGVTINE
jgi:site-specific recombinase XerD